MVLQGTAGPASETASQAEQPSRTLTADGAQVELSVGRDLGPLLSREDYVSLVEAYQRRTGRHPKVPTYRALCAEWTSTLAASDDPARSPFFHFGSCVVKLKSGRKLPIHFGRDEQVHHETRIITTLHLESTSEDVAPLFLEGLGEDELAAAGLRRVERGLCHPTVRLTGAARHLRCFARHWKRVESVESTTDVQTMIGWVQEATPMALDYWHSQGVTPAITEDAKLLFEHYTGGGFDQFIAFRVRQTDGAWGVGVFSRTAEDELYWDFSRRGIASHIGNNLLLAAAFHAQEHGIATLNLGVGFYRWKWLWATEERWSCSVRPMDGCRSELALRGERELAASQTLLGRIKGNKERRG